MSFKPTESGAEHYYLGLDQEFNQKSGSASGKAVETPAALLNGSQLLASVAAAITAALLALFLYVNTAPIFIYSDSAVFNVQVYNRDSEEPVIYILTQVNAPQDILRQGILPGDKSRLSLQDLTPGTTYRITYLTTEDGELKQLDEFLFTTKGDAPQPAPAPIPQPDPSRQPDPAPKPAPVPEPDSQPEDEITPDPIPEPLPQPLPGGGDDDGDNEENNDPPQPDPNNPPIPDTADYGNYGGYTVPAPDGDYITVLTTHYNLHTYHTFTIPEGTSVESVRVTRNGSTITDKDADYSEIVTEDHWLTSLWYDVASVTVSPGETIKTTLEITLSNGDILVSEGEVTPPYVTTPVLTITESNPGSAATDYIFNITGDVYCPPGYMVKRTAALFPGNTVYGFGVNDTKTIGSSERIDFSHTFSNTQVSLPDAYGYIDLLWNALGWDYPQRTQAERSPNSVSYSLRLPVYAAPPPAPEPEPVTQPSTPLVTLPFNITNVQANADGSFTYTETHVFTNLPGAVANISIQRNGADLLVDYQSIRSGDTLTVILPSQTLPAGASVDSRVSVSCSGQPKPLRSSLTITADMLHAAAGR